ncbi:MAG: hypothetical protein AAF515_08175 [Pseudomonadota bacterium]
MSAAQKQLLILIGIVFGTMGLSYLLFFGAQGGNVWGTTNAGEFVEPERSAADVNWQTETGLAFSQRFEEGPARDRHWSLTIVPAGSCDAECETSLSQMRALQVLLTKDATRLRRVLVLPGGADAADVVAAYPKLEVLRAGSTADRGLYLIDPNGNFVLRYPLGDTGHMVQKDLKKLLRISRIG